MPCTVLGKTSGHDYTKLRCSFVFGLLVMRILWTILLLCFTLVSAGQAAPVKKLATMRIDVPTAQTSTSFHRLSAVEGIESVQEVEFDVLLVEELETPAYLSQESATLRRFAHDPHATLGHATPLYLRVCRLLI